MFALALVLSVVGLAIGPALVAVGRGRALIAATIEGLTLGLVPILIVTRLLPHVMEELGLAAFALALAGYLVLWLVERRRHDLGDRVGQAVIIPALALHALSDGAALSLAFAASSREDGSAGVIFVLAIVMHRVPEGLFIATRLLPAFGWPRTLRWIALLAVTMVVGALAGRSLLDHVPDALFDAIMAFGLGAMIRMVMHAHAPPPSAPRYRAAGGASFVVGAALALGLPAPGSMLTLAVPSELPAAKLLIPLFLQTAPALLVGLVAAGVVRSLLKPRGEASALDASRGSLGQAVRGVLAGLARPSDAGRAVSSLRRLLAEGAPSAAAVGALVAALELDLAGAALLVPLLGAPFAAARLLAGLAISIVVSLIIAASVRRAASGPASHTHAHAHAHKHAADKKDDEGTLAGKVARGVREGLTTALDPIGSWYLAGLILASAIEAAVPMNAASRAGAVDPVFGALLAIVAPLSSQATSSIAAVAAHKGLSSGAALSLLVALPGSSFAVLSAIKRELGSRAAVLVAAGVLASAILAGFVFNTTVSSAPLVDLHAVALAEPLPLHWASGGLLLTLLVAGVLRLGPREWLAKMSADADRPHVGCRSAVDEHDHHAGHIARADERPAVTAE